jgi:tight adherence protein C
MAMLLPLLAFVFATLIVAAIGIRLAGERGNAIDRRLAEVTGTAAADTPNQAMEAMKSAVKKFGTKVPVSPSEMGKVRLRLVQAGHRGAEALPIFYGTRMAIAIGTFVLFATPIVLRPNVAIGLGGSLLGYLLPGIVLAKMAKKRQKKIQLGLADALDLMVVSVEAGLGLDQAIMRVGDELSFAHPDLSDELRLVNIEMRAGKGRTESLRNLADRTGLEDIASLTAMLIQTDKFGTSVAQSLRVHCETLRTKRRQRAEEAAAKTGVKMVFPLVFCIFPAIWVVTIGPAAIKFVQVLVPIAQNVKKH